MSDRRPQRLAALREAMRAGHIDALLVLSIPNVRYLTGFSGSSALVVVTAAGVHLLTDFRYETQAAAEAGAVAQVNIEPSSLWTGLWALLQRTPGIEIIGFESAHITHRDFERLLTDGTRWNWRPQIGLVEALREIKDANEVELIRQAGGMATRALERTLESVKAGLSELQIAGILEKALRDEGSEEAPFSPIVASGARAALPHARPSSKIVDPGEFLLLDFGAQCGGYCSDITRTVVLGRASAEQRDVYEIVKGANAEASSRVRAGMSGQDADALARRYIDDRGYGKAFGHSLGHGLGLEVHEAPRLARTIEAALGDGSVVTIEPGIYRSGWGGVRIEDDVHLGTTSAEILTDFTRELLEVA